MLFIWTFHSSRNPETKKRNMVSKKILCNTTVFKIDNDNKWEAGQHIRMISEGSCDTEDRSNDAKNSA